VESSSIMENKKLWFHSLSGHKLYNDPNEVDEDYLETLEESSNKDEDIR